MSLFKCSRICGMCAGMVANIENYKQKNIVPREPISQRLHPRAEFHPPTQSQNERFKPNFPLYRYECYECCRVQK